jgi:hypothetical protein
LFDFIVIAINDKLDVLEANFDVNWLRMNSNEELFITITFNCFIAA